MKKDQASTDQWSCEQGGNIIEEAVEYQGEWSSNKIRSKRLRSNAVVKDFLGSPILTLLAHSAQCPRTYVQPSYRTNSINISVTLDDWDVISIHNDFSLKYMIGKEQEGEVRSAQSRDILKPTLK